MTTLINFEVKTLSSGTRGLQHTMIHIAPSVLIASELGFWDGMELGTDATWRTSYPTGSCLVLLRWETISWKYATSCRVTRTLPTLGLQSKRRQDTWSRSRTSHQRWSVRLTSRLQIVPTTPFRNQSKRLYQRTLKFLCWMNGENQTSIARSTCRS